MIYPPDPPNTETNISRKPFGRFSSVIYVNIPFWGRRIVCKQKKYVSGTRSRDLPAGQARNVPDMTKISVFDQIRHVIPLFTSQSTWEIEWRYNKSDLGTVIAIWGDFEVYKMAASGWAEKLIFCKYQQRWSILVSVERYWCIEYESEVIIKIFITWGP